MNKGMTWLVLFSTWCGGASWAYTVQRVSLPSAAMDTSPLATIVLPDVYATTSGSYSTIYVLHGWSGNDMDWTANTDIGRLADEYGLILVMPDGGYNSWYIDSPVIAKSKFETYIGKEVVSYIDSHYRTVTSKGGRAITGLSMGGFGALNIAINNASTFGSAGSISGAVDPRSFWENWGLEGTFGDHLANANFWNEKAIINNADRFAENGINLTIDCGVDDFFVGSNRTLHQRLLVLNVPHDYTERPGGHTWAYWRNAIRYQVLFFSIKFEEGRGSLR